MDCKGEHLKDALVKNIETKKYFTAQDIKILFSGDRYVKSIQKRMKVYGQELK